MIAFLLKHWKAVSAGLLVLIVAGLLAWQDHRIKTLTRQRDNAQASLVSYQAALAAVQADTAAKIGALEAEGSRHVERVRNLERLLGKIEGAHDEEDGPLAPVLRDTIDSLYGADATGGGDKAGGAAKPAILRGSASASRP